MLTSSKPIPPEIYTLLKAASEIDASDLFLRDSEVPLARQRGALIPIGDSPIPYETMAEFWKFCETDPAYESDRDTSIALDSGHRFRVNLHRHATGIGAVLRVIAQDIPPLDSLGLPTDLLQNWGVRHSGLILVTGPTGAGKSTTIASTLDWINHNFARHIVSIEDPIEFLFRPDQSIITQREVFTDTDSFARGLRSSLRQAPDIIFLGEIRDPETASIALQAAETGHLVFSTLHSSNVAETIDRLVHLFPSQERASQLLLLSNQLIGVICQRLLPGTSGGFCPVVEHFENLALTRKLVREGNATALVDFIQSGESEQNRSFLDSLVAACRAGKISPEIATAAAPSPSDFRRAMRGIA